MSEININLINDKKNIFILKNEKILNTQDFETKFISSAKFLGFKNGNTQYNYLEDFSNNRHKYKNKIILSARLNNSESSEIISALNQNNFANHIKLFYNIKSKKKKILFGNFNKNSKFNSNFNNIYLSNADDFKTKEEESFNNSGKLLKNKFIYNYQILEDIDLSQNLNTFYYNFKPHEFIHFDKLPAASLSLDISYNINNIELSNNFLTDLSNTINYNIDYFKKIYYQNNVNKNILDFSLNSDYNSLNNKNLFIFNTFNNETIIDISYHHDISEKIFFSIEKTDNIKKFTKIFNDVSSNSGKFFINNNSIILNDVNVISKELTEISNNLGLDNLSNNKIYLSIKNSSTGLRQKDFKNILIKNKKIYFKKEINSNISDNLLNNYLIDQSYNYNYVYYNKFTNIVNSVKRFDISYENIVNLYSNHDNSIYSRMINSINFINNVREDSKKLSLNNNKNNIQYKINSYNIPSNFLSKINNSSNIDDIINVYRNNINLDFRFNYDNSTNFDLFINKYLNLNNYQNDFSFSSFYDLSSNMDNQYLLLNLFKIDIRSFISVGGGSDFNNVDCIFVYHDVTKERDASYLYPYNNIEIIRDPNIDNLSRAIQLLPGARTSTTNSTFIPARNGSNLSRKMIQGYIGLNNIGKLLSIEPYDENFTTGRGFQDQYIITDECLTYEDKVQRKLDSQNSNLKNIGSDKPTRRNNFSSLVRSGARNKLSKRCQESLQNGSTTTETPLNKINVRTPFKLYKPGLGKYIN